MLRRHPHLEGLILGFTLLGAAAGATPYALSCIIGLGPSPAPLVTSIEEHGEAEPTSAAREDSDPPVDAETEPGTAEPRVGLDGEPLTADGP